MRPIDSETLLDRALEGESSEVKARVRDVVIKLGIHPDDPFFIISIGLGHLQVLIEDGPKEWQGLFSSFEEVLSEWAATNLKTLSLLAQRTETMERLATNSEQLSNILIDLTQACSALLRQLPQSDGQLTSSVRQLENSSRELTGLLNGIQSRLVEQERRIESLAQSVSTTNRLLAPTPRRETSRRRRGTSTSIGVADFLLALIPIGLVALIGFGGTSLYLLKRTDQRTEWLLEKATRLECLQGLKDLESAECQRFFEAEEEPNVP